MTAILLFGRRRNEVGETGSALFALLTSLVRIVAAIAVHNICYYNAHKTMHSSSKWYRFHQFHHQFRQYIPPSSANAVLVVECLRCWPT
jgi:sterol desaturase/sphingolipid hydroxylase (fatty acid hydroxylase superfamily)